MQLTEADRAHVAGAIAAAEAKTAGEVVVILATDAHRYHATALAISALVALAVPLLALLLGLSPATLFAGWDAAEGAAETLTLEALLIAQAAIFAAVLLLCLATPLHRLLTPPGLRRDRVHRAALVQFRARGLDRTAGRTGVLLYIDAADHVADVVADTAIHARVAADHWGETVAALLDGMKRGAPADGIVAAVALAGRVLAEHFPPAADDVDELPNRLIEI
jgi:putative membrane protein